MDFNKLKEKGLEYVEKGRLAAADLTEKGRIQTRILTDQAKLIRAQRQLVYSLAKGNEENQPLVDKYIDMIGAIEQEIAQLKAKLTPAEVQEVERAVADVEIDPADVMDQTEDEAEPMETAGADHCCPQCGAPVEPGSLFCNKCGAQL